MARTTKENGRLFIDKLKLAKVITEVWRNMSEQYLKDLHGSISDRLLDVSTLHGGILKC